MSVHDPYRGKPPVAPPAATYARAGEDAVQADDVPRGDRDMAMLAHLLTFSGYVVPLGNIIGPVVIYAIKKDESSYVAAHAREAINFQITMMLALLLSAILVLVFIGACLFVGLLILDIVVTIKAAVRAQEGEFYRYPMTIRFV